MKAIVACSTSLACHLPLADALEAVSKTGAKNVDLLCIEKWAHVDPSSLAADFEAQCAQLDALLERHKLRITCLNTLTSAPLHDQSTDACMRRAQENEAILKFMVARKIPAVALQPPLKWQEAWTDEEQDAAIESLREEVARARASSCDFCLELHTRSAFETPRQVRRLLDAWADVPLVYDPTHFILQGVPLSETAHLLDRAQLIHLRDAAEGHLQVELGRGAVDFDWILDRLRARSFAGHISIEYLGEAEASFDVLESAKRLHAQVAEAVSS